MSVYVLDALHVVGALRAGVTTFVTYDDRQRDAALAVGLTVEAPAQQPFGALLVRPAPGPARRRSGSCAVTAR